VAEETADFLRQQAAKCCRLAQQIHDLTTRQRLIELAEEYEARARAAENPNPPPPSSTSE
jgi:hypothetical protein